MCVINTISRRDVPLERLRFYRNNYLETIPDH